VLIHATSHQRTYDPRIPRDWRVLMDDGVEAAFESEKKSTDVRRGVAGAAMAGKAHGASAYGYTRRYEPTDRRVFTEIPDEHTPIARENITRVAQGHPIKKIVDDLNERGIPSPSGGVWTRTSLKKQVRNPVYIGYRRHNGQLHRGNWDPIVDEAIFWRAQDILDDPDRKKSPPGQAQYLLSYIAKAKCGGDLHPNGKRVRLRLACHQDGCASVDLEALDAYVVDHIEGWASADGLRQMWLNRSDGAEEARAELKKLTDRLDEARASAEAVDGISFAALAKIERALEPQIERARERVQAEVASSALKDITEAAAKGIFREAWALLPVPTRRALVRGIFESITVHPQVGQTTLTRWSSDEDRKRALRERVTVRFRYQREE
jgi:hypothetical protein